MARKSVSSTEIQKAIETLQAAIGCAKDGLPESVFLFVSSLTPMVNVDLLVRDPEGRTLLTWRHDEFYGPGWHIPGGIIRFKEHVATRIALVAADELGVRVNFEPIPLCTLEMFNSTRDIRGHFISQLFACTLASELDKTRQFKTDAPRHGDWAWHNVAPKNLLNVQEQYRIYINAVQYS
jgi:ADP-ribose pyrophosphatase YjhB (NUDIX family)